MEELSVNEEIEEADEEYTSELVSPILDQLSKLLLSLSHYVLLNLIISLIFKALHFFFLIG